MMHRERPTLVSTWLKQPHICRKERLPGILWSYGKYSEFPLALSMDGKAFFPRQAVACVIVDGVSIFVRFRTRQYAALWKLYPPCSSSRLLEIFLTPFL